MPYDLRNKKRKINNKNNSNKKRKYDSDVDTIYSTDIEEEIDNDNLLDWNIDILNQDDIKNKLTKTIVEKLIEDTKKKDIKNINEY